MTRPVSAAELPAQRSPRVRAAVSNGKLPGGVSACSAEGRRFSDVVHDLTGELGGELSAAEQLQVRAIAGLVVHAEQLQGAVLRGEVVDSEQFVRVSNSAARLIASLRRGRASRRAKSTGGVRSYLAEKAGAA